MNAQKQAANFLSVLAKLLVVKAVARQSVDRAEDFIISIIEKYARDTAWEFAPNIGAIVTNVAPRRANLRGWQVVIQLNVNHG